MAYFAQFPFINYEFTDGVRILKDISIRPDFIQRVIENHSNYEFYNVREGDTPESLAYDFYGDATLHWVIMLANDILNLTSDWALTTAELDKFLLNEYRTYIRDSDGRVFILSDLNVRRRVSFKGTVNNLFTSGMADETIHESDGTVLEFNPLYFDDENGVKYPFDSIVQNGTVINPRNLDLFTGQQLVAPRSVSIFEREVQLNDDKRRIIIVKQRVINDIQTELRNIANG